MMEPEGNGMLRRLDPWFWGTALLTFLADQTAKALVQGYLHLGQSIPLAGPLRITYVTNPGAAFGLFPGATGMLVLASLVGMVLVLYIYRSQEGQGRLFRLALGLQMGGAMGNLLDRLRLGYVVDFIDLRVWPVFNLADSSIVVGLTLLVLLTLWSRPRPRREEAPTAPAEPPSPPEASDAGPPGR